MPIAPREFAYSRHHPRLTADLPLALEVQIKVVRARTLAQRDGQGRLSYSFKVKIRPRNSRRCVDSAGNER
jgi:hypothetical protein